MKLPRCLHGGDRLVEGRFPGSSQGKNRPLDRRGAGGIHTFLILILILATTEKRHRSKAMASSPESSCSPGRPQTSRQHGRLKDAAH